MDPKQQTLEELAQKAGAASSKQVLVGFDGFVDKLMTPVDKRSGQGENFTPMATITTFGERVLAAAGKSANIELYPKLEKLGGNGPIMANALLAAGFQTQYVGALGLPEIHPVFAEFAARTKAKSVCDPGVTHALEFDDGKLMLGTMASLDELTYERIVSVVGEGVVFDLVNRADLLAIVNWTMIPNMTAIFHDLLSRLLPNLGPKDGGRTFFFDLCDPRKRSEGDLRNALQTIAHFRSHGAVTLGLNLSEAQQVCGVLSLAAPENDEESLKRAATQVRQHLELTTVVIHPTSSAACATRDGAWYVDGPYCEKPLVTTGAGDHFNAGFSAAQLLGLSPIACLMVAVCYSGQYVRTAKSPSLSDTDAFLRQWR